MKKYWQGISTLREEDELLSQDGDSDLQDEKESEDAMFLSILGQYHQIELDLSDDEIMENIRSKSLPRVRARRLHTILKYAATVLILVSLGATYLINQKSNVVQTAVSQETLDAYAITKDMLILMSSELNKGEIYTYPINEFEETIQKLKSENL